MKAWIRACSITVLLATAWLVAWPLTVTGASRGHTGPTEATLDGSVNINIAGVKELTALDGVGKKLAQKIVDYRDAHGPFKKPEELRKVEGLGKGLWERNRDRIVVK
jgi:competence protein ComEA